MAVSYQAPERLGRYELLGPLATGGMAEIHLARLAGEAGFEKIVVVKRLLPELVASRAFVEMFLAEGKLVARLDHPNICEVHELGRDGAEYFLAMPYLEGVAVSELVARPLADVAARARVAAAVVVQACAGLHHAHERGVVHRDVSPSNLFLTTAGVVKVLDFGIAKVHGATAQTEAGMVKGKAQYMAPEQVLGGALDRRCDVFGLGTVLFELVTGTRLFARDSDYLAAKAILEDPIPRADDVCPGVSRALADAIAHALARSRDARPASAAAFAAELEAAAGELASPAELSVALAAAHGAALSAARTRQSRVLAASRAAEALTSSPDTGVATRALPQQPAPRVDRRRRRRGLLFAAAGVVAVALVGGVAFVVTHDPSTDPAAPQPPTAVPAPTAAAPAPTPAASPPTVAASPPTAAASSPPPVVPPPLAPAVRGVASAGTARAAGVGQISIDATPWANVSIDGRALGATPLLHVALAAGRHRVHAVAADGRTRDATITIEAGRAAPPLRLRW